VGAARRFVRDRLPACYQGQSDLVALLVSELATNAVRHARTPFSVCLHVGPPLRVEVLDESRLAPVPAQPTSSAEGGRGLQILDRLSLRWGTEIDQDTKLVWFEL